MEDRVIETIQYRGYSVDIFCDDYGQCFWCVLDDEEVNFGTYNTNYEDDLKYLIDSKLDTIMYFDSTPGARLMWFDNSGHRDIELLYRTRILKVWNINNNDIDTEEINDIKLEAQSVLNSYK